MGTGEGEEGKNARHKKGMRSADAPESSDACGDDASLRGVSLEFLVEFTFTHDAWLKPTYGRVMWSTIACLDQRLCGAQPSTTIQRQPCATVTIHPTTTQKLYKTSFRP